MVDGAVGLMALHHRHRLGAERAAEPFELGDEMRDVRRSVGEDQRLEGLRIGERVFRPEPGAPRLAEQVDDAKAERVPDDLDFLDITAERPEAVVVGPVRRPAAELVEADDAVLVAGKAGMGVAHIVARKAGAAVQTEEDLLPRTEGIGHDLVAVDGDAPRFVSLPVRHRRPPSGHATLRQIARVADRSVADRSRKAKSGVSEIRRHRPSAADARPARACSVKPTSKTKPWSGTQTAVRGLMRPKATKGDVSWVIC